MSLHTIDETPGAVMPLGRTAMTATLVAAIEADLVLAAHAARCLARHVTGDWGDVDAQGKAMNDEAVRTGEDRVFSVYQLPDGITGHAGDELWIITESDRSATTILWPSDY